MLYPVYVHPGNKEQAHGVTIPDFPGCFSAADRWDELPAKVQEAVEVYCEGEDMVIPAPSSLEILMADETYAGGIWMMIDIDTGKLNMKSVRLNVSLPESLVKQIDEAARGRHMSRSAFLAMSAQHELASAE